MSITLNGIKQVTVKGNSINIEPSGLLDNNEQHWAFWLDMAETILEQDPECTACDMIEVSPLSSLSLLLHLAAQINKLKALPELDITDSELAELSTLMDSLS